MTSFLQLKKNSGKGSLETLTAELTKLSGKQTQESRTDDRIWYPSVDKAGNGYAVIRFLPPPEGEDVPFIRMFDHGFQGPTGQWYIENSLTTLGKQDPVSELNTKLWATGLESDKAVVRKQKRKLNFYSNIYIIKDENNPENEGKVFLFKYGKKIFDKLNEAMQPAYPDEDPLNPFDLWEGADFKLKIRNVEGYRNYDKSEFAKPSALSDDDKTLERIWKQCHSLQAFLAPSNFKSYDELKTRLNLVLGLDTNVSTPAKQLAAHEDLDDEIPWQTPTPAKATPAPAQRSVPAFDDDDDDGLEFFNKLASKG